MECPKCTNTMATSALITPNGVEIMVAGTIATGPRPLSAQVCSACGFTELYAAQFTEDVRQAQAEAETIAEIEAAAEVAPPAEPAFN